MKSGSIGSPDVSRSHKRAEQWGSAGFTLIEALCAMAVASLAIVALLQSFSGGHRGLGKLESHFNARILARTVLADEQATGPIPGTRTGTYKGYRWTVTVEPAAEEWAQPAASDEWRLYRMAVMVSWGSGGSLTVETLKLGSNR